MTLISEKLWAKASLVLYTKLFINKLKLFTR